MVADISERPLPLEKKFDLIICDAPCSGSGTWSRTPEQLYFFAENRIQHYSTLQKKIVSNAVQSLRKGSYFLYITCSVYREENEDVATFIEQNLSIQLLQQQYFVGYTEKADTLFTALFIA
jgi:16S rRNA (cytosine967-C5)-methyltransferase